MTGRSSQRKFVSICLELASCLLIIEHILFRRTSMICDSFFLYQAVPLCTRFVCRLNDLFQGQFGTSVGGEEGPIPGLLLPDSYRGGGAYWRVEVGKWPRVIGSHLVNTFLEKLDGRSSAYPTFFVFFKCEFIYSMNAA